MTKHIFCVLVLILAWSYAEDVKRKTIKGQQFVRQTAVARLVGGPIPPELLKILQNNVTIPADFFANVPPVDVKKVPHLITDEVKTTVTRMVIPLVTSYADSDRYLTMVRKFLNRNHVNLSHVDKIEGLGDVTPSTAAIALKLQAAANLKDNMLTILGNILAMPEGTLPPHHHAPLAYIHRLLQLRRIPVIDLLEHYATLGRSSYQDQWLAVFSELEKHIPPYLKSCTTFLIESVQEKTLNLDEIIPNIKENTPKLLRGILHQGGSNTKPLLFPKRILTKIKPSHEEALGRSVAAMLTTVAEGRRNLSPRLLALFLLHLPRNTPNPQHDEKLFSLAYFQDIVPTTELASVAEAIERGLLKFNSNPSEIFQDILSTIVLRQFEGYEKYQEILAGFQLTTEAYLI